MKKNKSIILYSFFVPIFIFGLAAALPGCKEPLQEEVSLEFWGVYDDSDVFSQLIDKFNEEFPRTRITYYKKTYETYEKDLLEAMVTGRGPDIFMLHNTWLPRYGDRISFAPESIVSFRQFQTDFVDVVINDFSSNSAVAALPLSVDTLALYYNKDIFNTASIPQPPITWDEFLDDVEKITVKDDKDNIILAGAALGTARNINRSTDILSLLMLQSGLEIFNTESGQATFNEPISVNGERYRAGERALEFYTDFANPLKSVYTWNDLMHYSIDAFYEGKTATMLNYSYHIPTIRAKASYLNFGVAAMPQIKTASKSVNYANYWGLTVSRNSPAPDRAWQFINWLAGNKENARMYLELTEKPSARRDLILEQASDPDLGIFAEQALTARSWYQVDNRSIEQILADMIESVVAGKTTIEEAVNKASNQITLLAK
jgi:ABC-type glycerol-3-phosphate transport system substrate-binding protein